MFLRKGEVDFDMDLVGVAPGLSTFAIAEGN